MSKKIESVADAAAFLSSDPEAKQDVEKQIQESKLVTSLLHMRVQKGMTQKEIAEALSCDPSKISKLEAGTDFQLKWGDIVGYLSALGVSMNIMFEDSSLPAAEKIKHHVFSIHSLLEDLSGLAKEVDDDREIVDKIHSFYGEVLLNFLARFEGSYQKLASTVTVGGTPDAVEQYVDQASSRISSESEMTPC